MIRTKILPLGCLPAALALASCGGAGPEPSGPTAEPAPPGDATMAGAVLTTEVDADSGEPAAPVATEFPQETAQIYLVARLNDVPAGTEIEVAWIGPASPDPFYTSRSTSSGGPTLVAKLLPPLGGFEVGSHRAFVYVAKQRLGSVTFRIGKSEARWTGVRELNVSGAVEAFTHKAIDPRTSFHQGISKVYASFLVRTDDDRPFVRITWLRDDGVLLENDLECGGEVRCLDVYDTKKPMPGGDYSVEVDVNGEMLSRKSFHVGGTPVGPVLDYAALGAAKGKKKMPRKSDDTLTFKSGVRALRVGVRLLTLPDEAAIRVQWVAIDGGGGTLHESEVAVTGGGDKSEVVDWEPETPLAAGRYKAVILLGQRVMEELGFTVE